MNTKRVLYKPAVKESIVPKERRKALPQGRLVTKSTIAESATETGGTRSATSDRDAALVGGVVPESTSSYTQASRRHLAAAGANTSVVSSSGLRAENNLTPRKNLPHASLDESPKAAKPSESLDLSDTDDERNALSGSNSEVLVVDASRPLRTLDDTEVDVALHFSHSPARVICHTPGKVHTTGVFKDSGNVHEAARVNIDKTQSFVIGGGIDHQSRVGHNTTPLTAATTLAGDDRPPLVVRESGLPAAALPHFRALMAMSDHRSPSGDSDQMSSDGSQIETDVRPTVASAVAGRAEPVQVNSGPAKARAVCLAMDEDISSKLKAKRKPPKVVSSRYMQPVKGPLKADRSVLPEGYTTRMSSFATTAGDTTRAGAKPRPGAGLKRSVSDTKMKPASFSITPDPRASFGGHSSTPTATAEDSLFLQPSGADISAIGPPPILDVTGGMADNSYSRHQQPKSRSLSRNRAGEPSSSDDAFLRAIRPNGGEVTQWDLELLYGVQLQFAFLESKARKCLRDQEKQATSQIYALWELVEKARRRKAELELQRARLRHTMSLDEALELQTSGLSAVSDKLSQVSGEYHQLASALDSTRHHMATKGIFLPSSGKDEYFDELSRALQEQEHLLGEISVMTRKHAPGVGECAKVIGGTENIVEQQTSSIARCQTLLSSVCSLLTQETSLHLQQLLSDDIQQRPPPSTA